MHYKDYNGYWYKKEPLKVGDTVEVKYCGYSNPEMRQGSIHTVTHVTRKYTYDNEYVNGTYESIYSQNIRIAAVPNREYSYINFEKVEPNKMPLQIEAKRPTIVVEVTEELNDTEVELKELTGTAKSFDSLSAARVYASRQITDTIREKNEYKKFRIYQEVSIAQAKEPEIEFK